MMMTEKQQFVGEIKKKPASKLICATPGQLLFCFMSVFSLALIIRNSDTAIEYMARGLKLCTETVIPSLFPFMVISELIVGGSAVNIISFALCRPMKLLFGIGGKASCAVILGTLCGFPVGTRCAVSLYNSGQITKKELQRVITFANNPSSAFIISAVGVSLFGCRKFGVLLYVTTLLSAAVIGIFQNVLFRKERKASKDEFLSARCKPPKKASGISAFTSAITSSATAMLNVCAFVIFFSAFIGTLGKVVSSLNINIPQVFNSLIFGFFELTSGVSEASAVEPIIFGTSVCAFIVGWSGLSVHFQIISLCDGTGISFRPYFIAKLFQGILNVLFLNSFMKIFSPEFIFRAESVSTGLFGIKIPSAFGYVFSGVILIAGAYRFFKRK